MDSSWRSADANSVGQSGGAALTEDEVRRLVRLLVDALAPDNGRAAKIGLLMTGLCRWLDADGWFWVRSRVAPAGGAPVNIDFLFGGEIDDRAKAAYADRTLEVDGVPPEHPPMRELLARGRPFTVTRPDIVPDEDWAKAPTRAYVQRFGFDELLYAWFPIQEVDGGVLLSGVVLLRRPGKAPFDARARSLVHVLFTECGALHTAGLRLELLKPLDVLSPRQRAVLALLLEGLSLPAISEQLLISVNTVKAHVKAIYRQFDVGSRAQLVRRFSR